MFKSLWIASTGMEAQQLYVDVISNNLANVNTVGFKKNRVDFEDLLYMGTKTPGAASSPSTEVPTGVQIGQGVRPVATQKQFSMGSLQRTENPLDVAIEGDGFFQIIKPDGETAYTRDGTFKVNSSGNLVNSNGYLLEPSISVTEETRKINISADGIVSILEGGDATPVEVGNIELARFVNPTGLLAIGGNLFVKTAASGEPVTGVPGESSLGAVSQGFLELSNVSVVEEMVNMIVAQRAYEVSSKSIKTADDMLQMAANLRR